MLYLARFLQKEDPAPNDDRADVWKAMTTMVRLLRCRRDKCANLCVAGGGGKMLMGGLCGAALASGGFELGVAAHNRRRDSVDLAMDWLGVPAYRRL